MKHWLSRRLSPLAVEVSVRTAVVAGTSYLVARLFRLPEPYWAPITALVVSQFTIAGALVDARDRVFGTTIGAIVGAVLARYLGTTGMAFLGGVFLIGLMCALLKLSRASYRFGTITIAIVMLAKHPGTESSPWIVGLHRWIEVTVGGAIALAMAWVWPDPREPAPNMPVESTQHLVEKPDGSDKPEIK